MKDLTLLRQFAEEWNLQVEGDRCSGVYGFIMEREGQLWAWTHTYSPNGHRFFPIATAYDEVRAVLVLIGWK